MNRRSFLLMGPAAMSACQVRLWASERFRSSPSTRPRATGHGWEVETDHFTVLATTRSEHARVVAEQAERTWSAVDRLATFWLPGDPPRRTIRVGILIDDNPRRVPRIKAPDARFQMQTSGLYVSLAPGEPPIKNQLAGLRRRAVIAFFQRRGVDDDLPLWVQQGMAGYFARRAISPQDTTSQASRNAPESVQPPTADSSWAERWVSYLIEGDDAEHLPAFLAALANVVEPDPTARRRFAFSWTQQPGGSASDASLARLVDVAETRRRMRRWLKDPAAGQPLLKPDPDDPPEMLARKHRMTLLLKLARRYASAAGHTTAKSYQWTGEEAKPRSHGADRPTTDFRTLARRLTQRGDAPQWATIDVDGTLLLSTDHRRVDALVHDPTCRYELLRRDGRLVLRCLASDGTRLESWLADNADNPARPLVQFATVASSTSPDKPDGSDKSAGGAPANQSKGDGASLRGGASSPGGASLPAAGGSSTGVGGGANRGT